MRAPGGWQRQFGHGDQASNAGWRYACERLEDGSAKSWDVDKFGCGGQAYRGDAPGETDDQLLSVELGHVFTGKQLEASSRIGRAIHPATFDLAR